MNNPFFSMDISREQDQWTIYLTGEVDLAAVIELTPTLDEVIQHCGGILNFDLGKVSFIDSEGIKILANACRQMNEKSLHACVSKCSKNAHRIMQLAGVCELFGIHTESPVAS